MSRPRVSVVMPSFKHEKFVAAAIGSVLSQTGVDLELIVVDDASDDGSWEIIQAIDDPRLRALRHESNQGAHASLNEGLELASGEVLAIINSDDRYQPERLARCLEALDAGADLVGSDIALIDDDGEPITGSWWIDAFDRLKAVYRDSGDWVATLLEGNVFMTTSNFVMTRECWQEIGPFRNLRFVHDYDFLLQALEKGKRLRWIDTPLLRYRLHQANTISESPLKANFEAGRMLRERVPTLLDTCKADRRRLAHLSSQWARMEGYIDEIHKDLRHHALVEQAQNWRVLVQDRDRWVAERDRMIADRNRWIADRDRWIAERDAHIHDLSEHIAALEHRVAERERWIVERDAQVATLAAEVHDLRFSRSYRLGHALLTPLRALQKGLARVTGDGAGPRRVRHLAAFRRHVQQARPALKCVSFDIFDTLLARCVEPPELVHRRVAEALASRLGNRLSVEQIEAARREEERALRQAALSDGSDHECHYDPLVEGWLRRLTGEADPALVAFVQDLELELESLALFVKPGIRELLEWIRAQGIRVIAVSDMYLGHEHLEKLLRRLDIWPLIDRVYMSAEFALGKYSGRLHTRVLEIEGLDPTQMAHLGDNLHSDALAPSQVGVHAFFLDDRRERNRRRDQTLSAEMSVHGGVWPGRQFFEVVATRVENDREAHSDDFFFRYGRDVLGPAFCTFTLGLIERLQAFSPGMVVFLARDGYLFQRIFEAWRGEGFGAELPPPTYAYASRRVVSSAAVADGLSHEQAMVAFYNPKQQGLLSVLKTYGLAPDEFAQIAADHGFAAIDEHLTDWRDARLLAFLADDAAQSLIREHGREARALLHDYFAQLGLFSSDRVALVDIGWNGTIQKFMQQSFGSEPGYPEVRGYYFALVAGMHGSLANDAVLEGLMLDARRGIPFERAPFDFEELFEQGARALHATTVGYTRDDSGVQPVLKSDQSPDRQGELSCNGAIDSIHRGVLCHARHFRAAQRLTGFSFETLKPYVLAQMERAVAYPTTEEVDHIRHLVHTEDFGHDHVLSLCGAPLSALDFLRPQRMRRKLHLSPWPYAQAAHLPTSLPAWLMRIAHLRRIRRQQASV